VWSVASAVHEYKRNVKLAADRSAGSEEPVNSLGDAETGPARMAAARSPITDGYLHLMASSLPVGRFGPRKTTSVARYGMPPPERCGPTTGRKRRLPPQSTSCGMSTPPNWSTPGCPWRRFAVDSVMPTPKQFSDTPSKRTPPPASDRQPDPGPAPTAGPRPNEPPPSPDTAVRHQPPREAAPRTA
jgi:hypothetical protein